jgi:hypothetical protein
VEFMVKIAESDREVGEEAGVASIGTFPAEQAVMEKRIKSIVSLYGGCIASP